MLNGPYANIYNDIGISFFGVIVIAAIFGTSILRDFQRDNYSDLVYEADLKFAYLGGTLGRVVRHYCLRFLGTAVRRVFRYSCPLGRPRPHRPESPLVVPCSHSSPSWFFRSFFWAPLFFVVAAISRRIFIVYLQGAAIFMLYLLGITIFSATRSLEHFWSGILDPVGFLYNDAITPLLDRGRTEFASVFMVAGSLPLQPPALGFRRVWSHSSRSGSSSPCRLKR